MKEHICGPISRPWIIQTGTDTTTMGLPQTVDISTQLTVNG